MATISTLYKAGTSHQSTFNAVNNSYLVDNVIDLADVVTAKGSAIAQGDVIEALYLPAGTQVLFAGLQVMEVMTGTSTDATVDLGITGGDVDAFVDGFDLDGAAAEAYATVASAAVTPATFLSTADTLDILVVTQTGTITGGKIRVFAHVLDVSDRKVQRPGIAQIGS